MYVTDPTVNKSSVYVSYKKKKTYFMNMPLSVDPPVKRADFSLVMYAGLLKPHLC